jgi:cell division transport system ATP-binding protein
MGIVPQDYALLPRKRAWENVAYAMRAVGNTRREVRRKWPRILEMVGLIPRAEAFPHELSGGEQQRVAIARALINDPQLLIADEPTGNLDPDRSWEIMEILIELNKQGTTILVASHDVLVMDRMREIARIITLDHGRIIADISPEPVIPDIVEPSLFAEPVPATTSEEAAPVSEQLENVESAQEEELSEVEPTPEAPHA